MKKKNRLIAVVLAALLTLVPALGAGAQGGTWNSGFQVVNFDQTNAANITMTYYDENGNVAFTHSNETVPAGGSKTYYQPSISGLPDGKYSVVIASDREVGAVTNLTNYTAAVADSYPGFSQGSDTVNLPLIMRRSTWKSVIIVQNTDTTASTNIHINFYEPGNSTPVYTKDDTLPQGASHTYDVSDAEYSALAGDWVGSAVITTDGSKEVVAIVEEVRTSGASVMSILPGFTSSGTKLLAPLVYKDYQYESLGTTGDAWRSGIQVMNVGSASTTVTMTLKGTNVAGTWTDVKTVAQNSSETFYLPSISSIPNGVYGSATIESSGQNIVAIVNTTKYAQGIAVAYNAFVDGTGTSKVIVPLVYRDYQGSTYGYTGQAWRSGIQVMNVGTGAANLKVTYTNANSNITMSDVSVTHNGLPVGESYTFYLPNSEHTSAGLLNEFYGSAVIESTNGQDIIAVINTTKYVGGFALSYPGFSK